MKVCVAGLWHLGAVTSACLASVGHQVIGIDDDRAVVDELTEGRPAVFEPGLEDLVKAGLIRGNLQFTAGVEDAIGTADVVWIAYDTPVDDEDRADSASVLKRVIGLLPFLKDGTLVLISSQLPVGSTRYLEDRWAGLADGRAVSFAYVPENLRLGCAIDTFTHPDRIVAGVRTAADRGRIETLLRPLAPRIEWMSVESAELTKHALNAFLATSISFINEIACLAERIGGDASAVARALKSDSRIGPKAYLSPGAAFAGGTLARDVTYLTDLGRSHDVATHLIASVTASNDAHRQWVARRLDQLLGGVSGKTVAVWGLTYKPGTSTLRRSGSIDLCRWLVEHGAAVLAHDPGVKGLPDDYARLLALADTPLAAIAGASALVVATPWPEYRRVTAGEVAAGMARALVLDENAFVADTLGSDRGIEYVTVGRSTHE